MIAPSLGFVLPATDGSIPLNYLINFHLKHNSHHPWIVLSATNASPEVTVTYEQLAHAVRKAVHIINPNGSIPQGECVAIIAMTDSITYLTLMLGISRAGFVPFPISPQTQPADMVHILSATNTSHVVMADSPEMLELINALSAASDRPLTIIPLPILPNYILTSEK
ncbi:AMP binding enzyme [Ceratobasidium sp. AG-Ba]|nr:AMP binding enzyme [Ceratobasidium sp. AG-Ba]QRW03400.1 AMP binding enzyme [Ceratobasidium sp. AG-Ba]